MNGAEEILESLIAWNLNNFFIRWVQQPNPPYYLLVYYGESK